MNTNFDEIKLMKKCEFKKIIKQNIEIEAKNDLNAKKLNHSKVRNLQHNNIGI